jgi:hypothetical protein
VIVDTRTLAVAAKVTARHIRRLAAEGILSPLEAHTGLPGRPTLWFDLDASMAVLDTRRAMSLTDH